MEEEDHVAFSVFLLFLHTTDSMSVLSGMILSLETVFK